MLLDNKTTKMSFHLGSLLDNFSYYATFPVVVGALARELGDRACLFYCL